MAFSKKKPLHPLHSTELFKIFFSLLTLSTAFLQKACGPGKNKMRFNATKCKVLQIHNNEPLYTRELPLAKYFYYMNNEIIDFTESEKDLGVMVNSKFKWDHHQQKVLNKAHQMLGITKRTCHFITDQKKRRSLYLSLVRSQFEHCSIIWRPIMKRKSLHLKNSKRKL